MRRYRFPECGYTKVPTTPFECGGNIVKREDTWRCDACETKDPVHETICTRGAATVPECKVVVVEMATSECLANRDGQQFAPVDHRIEGR